MGKPVRLKLYVHLHAQKKLKERLLIKKIKLYHRNDATKIFKMYLKLTCIHIQCEMYCESIVTNAEM